MVLVLVVFMTTTEHSIRWRLLYYAHDKVLVLALVDIISF